MNIVASSSVEKVQLSQFPLNVIDSHYHGYIYKYTVYVKTM